MLTFSVETLSLPQIRALYRERMKQDFPPDELKPLAIIEKALARDEYVCYGAVNGNDILAYAYFVKLKEQGKPYALFDYYAVRQDIRDRGVGIADVKLARQALYTTAGDERSGLGFTVMESFSDSLKVRSRPGKGTTVTFTKKITGKCDE